MSGRRSDSESRSGHEIGVAFGPVVPNDLFFAILTPRTHHTVEELSVFPGIPARRWFRYGCCAWRFGDDGELRADTSGLDPRWDPRCARSPD